MAGEIPYTIRESARARNVRLQLSVRDGLVVIVPRGFDRRRIPEILRSKQHWLENAWRKVKAGTPAGEAADRLPDSIALPAIGEAWAVTYRPTSAASITAREQAGRQLVVCGRIDDVAGCALALRRWLSRKAHAHLTPWLLRLAGEKGFSVSRVTIRFQRTRWGSASPRRSISLNLALLFLPPALARYVLIHELCHTVHLDHSPRFWALVAAHEPAYKEARRALRTAWQLAPAWLLRDGRPATP